MSESRERPSDPSEEREAESAERDEADEQAEGEARASGSNGEAKGEPTEDNGDAESEAGADEGDGPDDSDADADAESEGEDEDAAADGGPDEDEGKGTGEEAESASASEGVGSIDVKYFGLTDVGLIRDHNEDNFLVADLTTDVRDLPEDGVRSTTLGAQGGLFAVCDGMGGAAAGEVASQMAVDTLFDVLDAGDPPSDRDEFARRLVYAVEEAGSRIFSAAKMDRTRRGMGTTATVAGLIDKVLFVGQVGDSRAYVLRGDDIGLITKDQSLVNQLIEAGQLSEDEAEAFEHSNIILQALGTTEEVSVDLSFLELRKGDRLMVCSDGLSGLVHEEMIKDVLVNTPDQREACKQLVDMANNGGGHDNITVVVADFDGDALADAEGAVAPSYQQYPLPPAEDDETQQVGLQREPSQKISTERKLGAEVKRGLAGEAPPIAGEVRPFRWWLIAAVIVGAAVATAIALGLSKPGDAGEGGMDAPGSGGDPSGAAAGADDELEEPVEVRVQTDVTRGELFVDGQSYGRLGDEEEIFLHLPPGAYHFEARSGGNVVASANLTLRPGVPADVSLLVPAGTTDTAAELDGGAGGAAAQDAAAAASPEGGGTVPGGDGPRKTKAPGGTKTGGAGGGGGTETGGTATGDGAGGTETGAGAGGGGTGGAGGDTDGPDSAGSGEGGGGGGSGATGGGSESGGGAAGDGDEGTPSEGSP